MAGKGLKKSSIPGVNIRQLVEEIPEGCSTPDFQQKPVTLALQEGKHAIFRAVVCGEPRPEVHWERTKGDLSDPSKYQISSSAGGKEHVLQINKLTGEDTDLYRCIAVNPYGEAACSARLTVIEVGFRKSKKRQKEPPEDLRKELANFRKMLKKSAPLPAPEKKTDPEQVWQLLMNADRKDYERICLKYGIVDFRGMLRKLQEMRKEHEDKIAEYLHTISNLRHVKVTKDGTATFDLELDLKNSNSSIYLYKDGEMIPFGFDNQTKHCLRRLGKRYHFQIQDLRPEDAGIYQVRVEDVEVFSTELEASAIPPRIVVPLTEVRCEQHGEAVFECTLSSPCPNAAWHFQHRPFRPSDRCEVSVSPDGLTHWLVVRGAHFSDMGLYSLTTGLHVSSAWLVVEDKDHLTTSDDHQPQAPGAQASDTEDSGRISSKGGKPREQDPMGGSLKGEGLTSRLRLTASPERGGLGGHDYSLMGNESTADSAWGPGQERGNFPEAKGGRITFPGESQLHREGDWDRSLPGRPHLQYKGPDSGLMEGQQEDHGRDSDRDRHQGTAGGWKAGSRLPWSGGLEGSWEGKECREDMQGQEQLWDSQVRIQVGRRALLGSQFDPVVSLQTGEAMEISQEGGFDEMDGTGGLSREREKGKARAMRGYRAHLGEGGDSNEAGSPGTLGSFEERGSSSKAGVRPGSWRSQGGGDSDPGKAGVHWESGESLVQTSGGKGFQEPSISRDRKFPQGDRSAEGPIQEAEGEHPGESVVEEKGCKTGSEGSGGHGNWKGNLQEHRKRGLGYKDDQETARPFPRTENGSRSLQSSQGWTAGQREAGGLGNIASNSTGQIRALCGPRFLGSSGGKEGMGGMSSPQEAELMESDQGLEARSHRPIGSPGQDVQGSGGTLGDTNGLRGPGAIGSESDFWDGSWNSRGKGPRGEMGYKDGLGGLGEMEFSYRDGSGYFRGIGPQSGAGYSDGSRMPGDKGSGQGAGSRAASGIPGGIESEGGAGYVHSSGVPGEMRAGNKDGCDLGRRESGRTDSFKNGPGGPGGGPVGAAGHWDALRGQGEMGPGGSHLGSPGIVGSVGRGGLGVSETVGEEHVGAEPGDFGKLRPWNQTEDHGVLRTSGALGSSREEGYTDGFGELGATEPGSLKAGGKVGNGSGTRGPGARRSGPGTGWDDTTCSKALLSQDEVDSESQGARGSDNVLGSGDNSGISGPQGTGGRMAHGGRSRSLGTGGLELRGEASFGDGSGGLTGMEPGGKTDFREGLGDLRGVGPEGEGGFRGGSRGLGGMGPGGEAGLKDGSGDLRGMRPGGEAGFRGGSGGLRGVGPWGEAGLRDGSGDLRGVGPGGEASFRGGLGVPGGMGPEGEAGLTDSSGDLGRMGPGSEAGFRDGSGGLRGLGPGGKTGLKDGSGNLRGAAPGGEAGFRGGSGSPGGMGPGGEAGLKDGSGDLRRMGPGSEAGSRDGSGGLREVGPGGEAGYRNDIGDSRKVGSVSEIDHRKSSGIPGGMASGRKEDYKNNLCTSGGISSWSKEGYRGGLGDSKGMGPGAEGGCSRGSGRSGEMAAGGEKGYGDGTGRFGVTGSPAGMGCEGGSRSEDATEHRSGYWVTSEASHGSARAGPEVSSQIGGPWEAADGTAQRDSLRGPGLLGTRGGPEALSNGQASRDGFGGPRTPETLGVVGAKRKSGVSKWQDGSGIPECPRDRKSPSGEGQPADTAGNMGASGFFDGSQGSVMDEKWAKTAALESQHEQIFGRAGPGKADGSGTADQRGQASQEGGDLVQGGRRVRAGWESSAAPGQALDSSSMPGRRSKLASGSADEEGSSNAWAPGCEDGRHGQGSIGAGNQLPSSRASSSLQEPYEAFSGMHRRLGSSGSMESALGQEQVGGHQGLWSLDSKDSGSRKGTSSGPEDSDILGKENSSEWRNGLPLDSGESGSWDTWNGADGPWDRKGSEDRPRDFQGLDSQLGKGQRGRSRFLGEQGSLEGEDDKAQSHRTLKEYEEQQAEESGGPDRGAGSFRSRFQAQSGAETGAAKSRGTEAQSMGQPRGAEGRGHHRETQGEDCSQEPSSHLGSRRGGTKGRVDVYGQEKDIHQSPRSGNKPSTDIFSKEPRGPRGHFSQGLADTDAQQGEAVMLSCTLTSNLGPGTWFKDGVKLTAQDGVIFEQDGLVHRLLIPRVQGTQAGRYTFVAANQQSEATLTVRDPPIISLNVIEKLREPLVVKAGKPLAVKIPFESRLPVQATWRKDGAEVLSGSSGGAQVTLGDDFTRLCLPSTSRKDHGQYSVMLKSKGGSVQAKFTLQVIDKPQPPQGPLEVKDGPGASVSLRWQPPREDGGRAIQHYVVERQQAGRSTWLKVGEPPADSTTFTDVHVEQGKKYIFRVHAVTSEGAGDALQSEEVLVAPEAIPGPPSSPAILSASSQSITLTWTAPQGPGSAHLLGYLIEKRKKGSNNWTAVNDQPVPERRWTVVDLRQGCQYEFRVTAVAPSGRGEPGAPSDAVFARDPMKPPGPVRDLRVTDTSNTSITMSWTRPDAQDGDEAQGYVVELCGSDSLQWSPCHKGTVEGTTYTAKGLRPRQGYFVRVTAVNDGGCGQPTALDTIVQAVPVSVCPKFLVDSSTKDLLTFRTGDTVRVPLSFEAAPMPEVTWLKDGLPLPKRSVTTTKDSLTQLLIPAASLSDSGRYTVVLRNLQGKEATYSFLVRVAACPRAPGPIHLHENVPRTVTAEWEPSPDEAEAGGGQLYYTVLLRSSAHGSWRVVADRVHTNRFTLLSVLPGHEYHFRVVAKNELGASQPSDTSQPWYIPRHRDRFTVRIPSYQEPNLNQKPWFLVGLRAHLLPQGSECCMSCAVCGIPRPHVTWFKDNQSLEGNSAVYSTDVLGVCSLVIPSVTPKDSGQYKAVAENMLGQAVSTATLIVTGKESSS